MTQCYLSPHLGEATESEGCEDDLAVRGIHRGSKKATDKGSGPKGLLAPFPQQALRQRPEGTQGGRVQGGTSLALRLGDV